MNVENEQEAIFKDNMHENFPLLMKDFRITKYSESKNKLKEYESRDIVIIEVAKVNGTFSR